MMQINVFCRAAPSVFSCSLKRALDRTLRSVNSNAFLPPALTWGWSGVASSAWAKQASEIRALRMERTGRPGAVEVA